MAVVHMRDVVQQLGTFSTTAGKQLIFQAPALFTWVTAAL